MTAAPEATGNCYESAFQDLFERFIAGESDNWALVHGRVTGQGAIAGERIDHAWCEYATSHDGSMHVIDNSNGNDINFPRDLYYSIAQAKDDECFRYSYAEAAACVLATGHYGPWEGEDA